MTGIKKERFLEYNYDHDVAGKCVLYVMSRDQRVNDNFALSYAQEKALALNLPLAVLFVLHKKGVRSREHYDFMLEGLAEVEKTLKDKNIAFLLLVGNPEDVLKNAFIHLQPAHVFMDFSPLKGPRELYLKLQNTQTIISVIDTHNCVPVWTASPKQEVGARTLRPKIHTLLSGFLVDTPVVINHPYMWPGKVMSLRTLKSVIDEFLATIPKNGQSLEIKSGESAGIEAAKEFLHERLIGYSENRNDPTKNGLSGLSPYFHFGQLSVITVLRMIEETEIPGDYIRSKDAFIEEAVIRKELSDNYCYYAPTYRSIHGSASWAQNTLKKHTGDTREFCYSLNDFEAGRTHDKAWNAAQRQLTLSGKIHGYMRMYWAKKVLEWSPSPEEAIKILTYLNDFYSLDGGDPNGYTGIMWSVAGVHDRPWGERPVYGTIRSMVYSGLKRKFDIASYEKKWLEGVTTEI